MPKKYESGSYEDPSFTNITTTYEQGQNEV